MGLKAARWKAPLFEGLRWLGWGLAISLVPFVLSYAFLYYKQTNPPSLELILGSGQAFPTVFAMFAVAIKELQGPKLNRPWYADAIAVLAVIALVSIGAAYGYVTSERLSAVPQSPDQQQLLTSVTLILLAVGTLAAFLATIFGSILKATAQRDGA